jgi:hypothetical protein
MQIATINEAYTIFNKLSIEDKEYFLELIEKQIIESRRNAILSRASEAEENYIKGDVFTGDVDDIMEFLESD